MSRNRHPDQDRIHPIEFILLAAIILVMSQLAFLVA